MSHDTFDEEVSKLAKEHDKDLKYNKPKLDWPYALGTIIFSIRWWLVPIYLGLYIAIGAYIFQFYREIFTLLANIQTETSESILLSVLGLIDISMIGNLVVMTTIGGYSTFIRPLPIVELAPKWMHGLDSNSLKIKTMLSLVSVTAIHLLRTFMEIKTISVQQVVLEISIHMTFIVSLLAVVWYEWIHNKAKINHTTSNESH